MVDLQLALTSWITALTGSVEDAINNNIVAILGVLTLIIVIGIVLKVVRKVVGR